MTLQILDNYTYLMSAWISEYIRVNQWFVITAYTLILVAV